MSAKDPKIDVWYEEEAIDYRGWMWRASYPTREEAQHQQSGRADTLSDGLASARGHLHYVAEGELQRVFGAALVKPGPDAETISRRALDSADWISYNVSKLIDVLVDFDTGHGQSGEGSAEVRQALQRAGA